MMGILRRTLALSLAGTASLSLVIAVAPLPALACDVSSPTDISCPGANQNPANPLYSVGHPTPDIPQAPVVDPGYTGNPYDGTSVLAGGGILSLFGVEPAVPAAAAPEYAAPDEAPIVHRRHHHRHKHVE